MSYSDATPHDARPVFASLEAAVDACDDAFRATGAELCAYQCPRCERFHTAPWPTFASRTASVAQR